MDGDTSYWHSHTDDDGIHWLTFDTPGSGTNVLNIAALDELETHLQYVRRESPAGLVIRSGKSRGFIAGADVRSFTKIQERNEALAFIRRGQSLFDLLESLPVPTLALIHGYCLGGGLELALACRYRIARDDEGTRLGLPEVRLGIHPGFGGSLRIIQRIGAVKGLDMMLSGRSVSGRQAQRMGLVDYAVPERQMENSARHMIREAPPIRAPKALQAAGSHALLRAPLARYLHHKVEEKAPRDHYPAPHALIDIWARHISHPENMLRAEAESVADLVTGTTAQNLIRVFFLQERLKGLGRDSVSDVRRVHVIGAGVMGGDIAAWCALQGMQVSLQDQSPQRIAPAIGRAYQLFKRKRKKTAAVTAVMDRLLPDPEGRYVEKADVVIEAIFEDLDAKQALYRELEPRLQDHALLATNTSSIPLQELASCLQQPQRLVGLHFFNPVAKMQLVEVIGSEDSDPQALQQALAFTRAIDRLPLPARSTPGFLVNRILMPYLLEAVLLVQEGVEAQLIDQVAREFGMPMGPIELADTVGLDICLHVADILGGHFGVAVPDRLRELVAAGRLGRKTNHGFYQYRKGRAQTGRFSRAHFARPDVRDRLLMRMLNECVACVREQVVEDQDLLDAGMIFGTGFAPFRGGPMHYLRSKGVAAMHAKLRNLSESHGDRFTPDAGWEQLEADQADQ